MEKEMNVDIENLLRNKSWSQLNADERARLKEWAASESEYESVRGMFLELRAGAFTDETLQPSAEIHKNLLDAFDTEQRKRRALWWNAFLFSFRDKLRFDIPVVRYSYAGAIVVILLLTVFRFFSASDENIPAIVKNENKSVDPIVPIDSSADKTALQLPEQVDMKKESQDKPEPQSEIRSYVPVHTNTIADSDPGAINPEVDTTLFAQNNVVDTLANVLVVNSTTDLITSGSSTNLTFSGTPTANYTWNTSPALTFTYPAANVVTVSLGPEKTRSLQNDAVVLQHIYTLR